MPAAVWPWHKRGYACPVFSTSEKAQPFCGRAVGGHGGYVRNIIGSSGPAFMATRTASLRLARASEACTPASQHLGGDADWRSFGCGTTEYAE